MPPRDLWEVRQAAADRRKQLREAFIRVDPQLSGQVAPFLVAQIIKGTKVDVSSESINNYMCERAPHRGRALARSLVNLQAGVAVARRARVARRRTTHACTRLGSSQQSSAPPLTGPRMHGMCDLAGSMAASIGRSSAITSRRSSQAT